MRSLCVLMAVLPSLAFASTVSELMARAGQVKGAHMSLELKTGEPDTENEVLAQQITTMSYLAPFTSKVAFGTELGNGMVARRVIVTMEALGLESKALAGDNFLTTKASAYVMSPNPRFAPSSGHYDGSCSVYPAASTWEQPGFTIACTFPWIDPGKNGEYLQVMGFLHK